jgi:hypothetical protein
MGEENKSTASSPAEGQRSSTSEPLDVTSGSLAIIDQFMLSNNQFLSLITDDEAPKIEEVLKLYGGCGVELTPGHYRVVRNPYLPAMVIAPADGNSEWYELSDSDCLTKIMEQKEQMTEQGKVFIDTRCLALFDSSLLEDQSLVAKYRSLRESGKEKPARDLLREYGAAVRYGFQRLGDELGVYRLNEQIIAMWPETAQNA